jgi:hypothetical protein
VSGSAGSSSSDGFGDVFGPGRGLSDPAVLRERWAQTERELSDARAQTRTLHAQVDSLTAAAQVLRATLARTEDDLLAETTEHDACRSDLDTARYAAMLAGAADPVATGYHVHHGTYTPGRPYLEGQHVLAPETHVCFRARVGGVMPHQPPGVAIGWERCVGGTCPELPDELSRDPHPVQSGFALRQVADWWDWVGKRWALVDLSTQHLLAAIDWLDGHADWLYSQESGEAGLRVPCPPTAYKSPGDWLHDTPLWAALRAEQQRRDIPDRTPRVTPPSAVVTEGRHPAKESGR